MITTEKVKAILRTHPVGKVVGPDGISYRILRELAKELSTPLASLFNHPIHQGDIPVCFICRFPLPLGVWEGLRFVIVALPGLFSYPFFF